MRIRKWRWIAVTALGAVVMMCGHGQAKGPTIEKGGGRRAHAHHHSSARRG
jgi:hypothetical protein